MSKIQAASNNELWERWKEAMDDLCADQSVANSRKVNELEAEIFRRMQLASRVNYSKGKEAVHA